MRSAKLRLLAVSTKTNEPLTTETDSNRRVMVGRPERECQALENAHCGVSTVIFLLYHWLSRKVSMDRPVSSTARQRGVMFSFFLFSYTTTDFIRE